MLFGRSARRTAQEPPAPYDELLSLFPPERLIRDPAELTVYECDGLPVHKCAPQAVVLCESEEDVVRVTRWCAQHGIPFVLGHALEMKAIHGRKSGNDKLDAERIARLLGSGMFPVAYVYPKGMRSTRDLMRRRSYLVNQRSSLITHIQVTNHWRRMAETVAILTHSASSSPRDRSSNGCQPESLTGRLSLSHFTAESRQGRRRCSAPHPSPNLTRRRAPGSHPPSDRP